MDAYERQARNEALLRDANEQVERLSEAPGAATVFEIHCECGAGSDMFCGSFVQMTVAEYEEVRTQDDRFAVVPGHENPAIEVVVRRTDRYVVVDKLPEYEDEVADDPRGRSTH